MPLLGLIGDIPWILALAMMAGAARNAWKRVRPSARIPLLFGAGGAPRWRVPRRAALWLPLGTAFAVGVLLKLAAGDPGPASPDRAFILLGARFLSAAVLALIYLAWLKAALRTLAVEGQLKP